jgi:DNA-binding MarR family transcriptional regulator
MGQPQIDDRQGRDVQARYRDNFARHLISVALYLQSEVMNSLTVQYGHDQLRISFEPYITLSGRDGARLSDIAAVLGISRQAANQTANQIVAAGYLERRADPSDGRAKLLVPTARARDLVARGSREGLRLQQQIEQLVGGEAIATCSKNLAALLRALRLPLLGMDTAAGDETLPLAAMLPRLSDYINSRLMELTMARGHPDLKLSFGQVLTAIGPRGGRIQQMAESHAVSKQAISAIAGELESLGYIRRDPDPKDARQVVLQFTDLGKQLITDSVDAVDDLRDEFAQHIGRPALRELEQTLQQIYRKLHLEDEIFGSDAGDETDLRLLARQLSRQLGERGARSLGDLLLSGDFY